MCRGTGENESMDQAGEDAPKALSVWSLIGVVLLVIVLKTLSDEYLAHKGINYGRLAFMFAAYVLGTFLLTVPALRMAWNAVISRAFECRRITYHQSLALVTVIYVFLLLQGFPDT